MVKYILFVLLCSNYLFSKELVTDVNLVQELRSTITNGRVFLVKRFSTRKVNVSSLGIARSPIFKDKNNYYIDFNNDGSCSRVKLNLDGTHFARRISCRFIAKKFYVEGLGQFSTVRENKLNLGLNTDLGTELFSNRAYGITVPYRLAAESRSYKIEPIDFSYELSRRVVYINKKLRIETVLKNIASEFGYLSKKEKVTRSIIDVKEVYGDIILRNSSDAIILIKRYQPTPLNFRILSVNPLFVEKLKNVNDYLIEFSNRKLCFLDDLIEPNSADCHKVTFKGTSAAKWLSFVGIHIDLRQASLNLLK